MLAACAWTAPVAAQEFDSSPELSYPGAGSAGSAVTSSPVFSTSTLPSVGSGVRVGDLRPQLQQLLPRADLPRSIAPAVLFTPGIGVDVGFTDNAARNAGGSAGSDVFTLITPSILVSGDTRRVQANFAYTPTVELYASTPNANRVNHFLNAGAVFTVIPDSLFVDLRGSVTQQSIFGGFSAGTATPSGATPLNRRDQTTTASVFVSPYYVQRFGGYGTGQLAYALSYVDQGNLNRSALAGGGTLIDPVTGLPVGATSGRDIGNLLTHREVATFTSGEELGRIRSTLTLSATQYDGSGPYRNAHRNEVTLDNAYAITRTIAVLGAIGYQNLRYDTIPRTRVDEPLWNLGVRFAPNPEDFVSVRYGRRDGFNDFAADISYQTTPRTRVFLRYSNGLSTDLEEASNLLASTQVDPYGNTVDTATGRPVLNTTSNFFGIQDNLFRLRRLSASGVLLLDRDVFTLSLVHESRTLVGRSPTATLTSSGTPGNGLYTTLQWQHDLAPDLQSQLTLQYGTRDGDGGVATTGVAARLRSNRVISAAASLNYQLSQTISTRALYQFSSISGNGAGDVTQNLVLVGLRKTF